MIILSKLCYPARDGTSNKGNLLGIGLTIHRWPKIFLKTLPVSDPSGSHLAFAAAVQSQTQVQAVSSAESHLVAHV